MSKQYELEVDADVSWVDGVDPEDWRNLPDMDGNDDSLDEDESLPAPQYVIDVLGFDPDEEDWGESVENKESQEIRINAKEIEEISQNASVPNDQGEDSPTPWYELLPKQTSPAETAGK